MNNQQDNEHRKTVGAWLSLPFVWRIPVYQRHYAWNAAVESGPVHLFWQTVMEQTEARLMGKTPPQHYLGAVLVDNKTDLQAADEFKHYDVVDGQQRLTTIQIALLALVRVADEHGFGHEIKAELEKYVFSNKAGNQPRLFPTNFDNKQFQKVLFEAYGILWSDPSNAFAQGASKSKIVLTSEFFRMECNRIVRENQQHAEMAVIGAIMRTLTDGFDIVRIVLRASDEAQQVFESLNSYAEPLTTFDLIRNNVFYRAASLQPGKDVELFNTPEWQQLENPYWEGKADNQRTGGATHIQAYIARMLVAKMRKYILFNPHSIVKTYKEFCKQHSSIDEEIRSLTAYTDIYQYLDSQPVRNPVDGVDFGTFRYSVWKTRDFYPVIFLIASAAISVEQKQRMIKLLESYVIRRGVCKLSHGHYNQHAAHICAELGDAPVYEKLREVLVAATKPTTVFPNDARVTEGCVNEKFYGSVFQQYVFEQIEKSLHKVRVEKVVVEEGYLTIDHILPQGWDRNPAWEKIVLGDGGHDEMAALTVNSYIHTIGNLTLMSDANNTAKSNHPLDEVKGLLATSGLKLNRELAQESEWNVKKITARSECLAEKICAIWPYDIA